MLAACPARVIATSTDCYNAQASVDQMNQTFLNLGSPAQYSAQVSSITQSLANAMPWVPMTGFCGTAYTIGCQADDLTNTMLASSGQTGVPGPTSGGGGGIDFSNLNLSNLLGGPGLLVAGIVLYLVLKK